LDRAASQAGEAERAALLARRRRKGWELAIYAALAALGLLAAALLARRQLRVAAQREGARAMRDELLERTSDGYFALDRDFRFVYLNSQGARTMKRTRASMIGKTIWEVWPGISGHPMEANYRAAMEGRGATSHEVLWGEEKRWFELRFFPSPEGLSVFCEDITEARAMREALAESEARHRRIVQTAQEGIWVLDAAGKTTFVNEKLCELLGYPREELLGKHLFDFMDAEGERIAAENLQRRGLGLRELSDFKFLRKDGSTLWGLLATSPLSEDGGGDASTLAMLTDLTERRQAEAERELLFSRERALRTAAEANHDRYRVLANLVPHIVWTHRADGSVDFVNRSYAEQSGQPSEQALGSGWQAMIHPEDLEGYLEAWKSSLLSGEPFQREVRMRRADGSWRWQLNMAHAARDAEGRLLRWFGVALELDGRTET
jgi:PAS domain S-box-containing protein